jgi:hypothetical protein
MTTRHAEHPATHSIRGGGATASYGLGAIWRMEGWPSGSCGCCDEDEPGATDASLGCDPFGNRGGSRFRREVLTGFVEGRP